MLSTLSSRSSRSGFDRLLGENCTRASSAWRGREQRDGSPLSFAQPAGAEQQRQRRRWHESGIDSDVAISTGALPSSTVPPALTASRSDLDTSLDPVNERTRPRLLNTVSQPLTSCQSVPHALLHPRVSPISSPSTLPQNDDKPYLDRDIKTRTSWSHRTPMHRGRPGVMTHIRDIR
jgi:hypothetical protein